MISIATAIALKKGGLKWSPALHDFFAVPEAGLDDRVFVLSDMTVDMEVLNGWPAITFNGAVEWALDYVLQADAIWLPREDQLRTAVEQYTPALQLIKGQDYRCTIRWQLRNMTFSGETAPDAYAATLLHLLDHPL